MDNCDIGMVGLGVMGRNLLLNMAEKGYAIAGYDKSADQVEALNKEASSHVIIATTDIRQFIQSLRKPRAVIMLVPAGPPVDAVISDLLPNMEEGDLIIDMGNSYFKDTNQRIERLAKSGLQFMGVGVSGGEEGARRGPSVMPGGTPAAYERVRPILEAASAKVNGDPCVTYLGTGSAGHYVKMVHNGIEYGLMQLIAESYDLMKRGLGLDDDALYGVFSAWNKSDISGYLVEITAQIFARADQQTGRRLIDEILDVARQKGTGMWTSQSAMELQVPAPTIDMAVAMRDLSVYEKQRSNAATVYNRSERRYDGNPQAFIAELHNALLAGMIITYAQGLAAMAVASTQYQYNLNLSEVARIWRGGCIIRSVLLDDIYSAYRKQPALPNLLLDDTLAARLSASQHALRMIVSTASSLELPAPGFMSALSYFDAYRSAWLPANLIQAQRDYFGAHTYERIDAKGTFHTQWE